MVWDIGGQDRIRNLWRHYYNGTQGLIFVVDSSDRDRMDEARDELHKALGEVELEKVRKERGKKVICFVLLYVFKALEKVKVLVLANKQDLPQAMTVAEVSEKLQLKEINKPWYIQSCSAVSGD